MNVQWALPNGFAARLADWIWHNALRDRESCQKTGEKDDEEPDEGLDIEAGTQQGHEDRRQADIKCNEMAIVVLRIATNVWGVIDHVISAAESSRSLARDQQRAADEQA